MAFFPAYTCLVRSCLACVDTTNKLSLFSPVPRKLSLSSAHAFLSTLDLLKTYTFWYFTKTVSQKMSQNSILKRSLDFSDALDRLMNTSLKCLMTDGRG